MTKRKKFGRLLWNFTFGVEDSLVSTVGLVSGVAAGGVGQKSIILTGAVLVFVEALSMGVGSFLTEQSVEEFEKHKEAKVSNSLPGALVMFVSYFIAGLIPLLPYVFFLINKAFVISILFSTIALFILGYYNGLKSKIMPFKEGFKMAFFGGLAIIGGILVGKLFNMK